MAYHRYAGYKSRFTRLACIKDEKETKLVKASPALKSSMAEDSGLMEPWADWGTWCITNASRRR